MLPMYIKIAPQIGSSNWVIVSRLWTLELFIGDAGNYTGGAFNMKLDDSKLANYHNLRGS